ncbi:MAG: archaeosine biosynthesis radical SAM protein RaSEA [ANME-2 cluster archaeon]|nr:archaeosine biosynthesis radical SAM protein RaSEA [ANME-2 cluster archaeon]MBC2701864.1 archaeosine biosynthesis radical SAM protein RaSEA [ANME-2 cluster archaeon]MBC2707329.1 archaeosine biosynthesis radical SAM protein RaSEA [ANME-2 cluster archaeon]MBC2747188.1 archaeosine biosynthesis radical SAM protein RaSEA [ANME-2 cluster archaeon]MBC2763070.1 archaeosine biosynthesis radical SAM protein RaSEA [ANME-2 cluster archaeon]
MKKKRYSPGMPVAVWTGRDPQEGTAVDSMTVIFRTIGCYWSRKSGCTMCGYFNDAADEPPLEGDLLSQLEHALEKMGTGTSLLKIFTSGSFLDEREVSQEVRNAMMERIGKTGSIKKIMAETRPEFVNEKILGNILDILKKYDIKFEVAIGLETSSDTIRKDCINKGFTFNDFTRASEIASKMGVSTKAYLLQKPPFLSEKTAIEDSLASISDAAPYATTISLNLTNIQKGTIVEELYNRRDYRPPWLWSAVFVLRTAKEKFPGLTLVSDPVAGGTKRGPHNCRNCDSDVAQALRDFSITQDIEALSWLECECYSLWEKVVELEDCAFGSFLVK